MVLDKLDKTEKKLRILRDPPGGILKKEECLDFQVDCLIRLKRWDEAAERLTELVVKTPDQWCHVRQYISCQIMRCHERRKRKNKEEEEAAVAATMESEKELRSESGGGKEEEAVKGNESHGEISPPEDEEPTCAGEMECSGDRGCGEDASSCSWDNLR